MSSCSARSLEETHLLTMTSCSEKTIVSCWTQLFTNGRKVFFTKACIRLKHTHTRLPEPSVCSDSQVSPAHSLIGRLGGWCNTTSAPERQRAAECKSWTRWCLCPVFVPRYLGNIGCDSAESRQRAPRKWTQPRALERVINRFNNHGVTTGRKEGQSEVCGIRRT